MNMKRKLHFIVFLLVLLLSGIGYSDELKTPIIAGGILPDFEGTTIDNKYFRLSDNAGKYILIEFWATWCPSCRENNTEYGKIYSKYKNKGFEIVGVSKDKIKIADEVYSFLKKSAAKWPQLSLSTNTNDRLADRFGMLNSRGKMEPLPRSILIDPNQRIVDIDVEPNDLDVLLKNIVGTKSFNSTVDKKEKTLKIFDALEFKKVDEIWELSKKVDEQKTTVDSLIGNRIRTEKEGIYSRSKTIRRWAVFALGAMVPTYSDNIIEALSGEFARGNKYGIYDEDQVVRGYSVEVMGRRIDGNKRLLELLIGDDARKNRIGVYDNDPLVRGFTIWALSQNIANGKDLLKVIAGNEAANLKTGFYDSNPSVVTYSIDALSRIDCPEVILKLLYGNDAKSKKTGYYSDDKFFKVYSAKAIAGLKDLKRISVEELIGVTAKRNRIGLYSDETIVRKMTADVLMNSNAVEGKEVKDNLIGTIAEKNGLGIYNESFMTRWFSCLVLGNQTFSGIDVSEALVGEKAKEKDVGIYDKVNYVRKKAIWALGRYNNREYAGVETILQSLTNDPNNGVQKEARRALEGILETKEKTPVKLTDVEVKEAPNAEVNVKLNLSIEEGWHINSNQPVQEYLIPTKVFFDECGYLSDTKVNYPETENTYIEFFRENLSLFSGEVPIEIYALKDETLNATTCILKIQYQACDGSKCLQPDIIALDLNSKLSSVHSSSNSRDGIDRFGTILSQFKNGKFFLGYLLLFVAGLALNLTPCVYPIIPITLSFFGSQKMGNRSRTIYLASVYVFGIIIVYSCLGFISATTGSFFGAALQSKYVLVLISLILVILSLSMFEIYSIRTPATLLKLQSTQKSCLGAFVTGATAGLMAAPCVGPFILGLLVYVGKLQDAYLGFFIFLIFSFGLGFPILFLAIFSNYIAYIPKSGSWMLWIKKIFGFVLIGMAIYILEPILGSFLFVLCLIALLFMTSVYLGFIDKVGEESVKFKIIKRTLSSLIILFSLFFAFNYYNSKDKLTWDEYKAWTLNSVENKPIIIDFYADWCVSCKKLDLITFKDEQVISELNRFKRIKVNMTLSDTDKEEFAKRFGVKGFPAVIFIDSNGTFLRDKSVCNFVSASDMLDILRGI